MVSPPPDPHSGRPGRTDRTGPDRHGSWDYAATAEEALAQLDREYARWIEGVRGWDEEDLQVAVGEAEGPWAEYSRATLVAHIHRELIHHLAEVCLLRDLYAHATDPKDVTR